MNDIEKDNWCNENLNNNEYSSDSDDEFRVVYVKEEPDDHDEYVHCWSYELNDNKQSNKIDEIINRETTISISERTITANEASKRACESNTETDSHVMNDTPENVVAVSAKVNKCRTDIEMKLVSTEISKSVKESSFLNNQQGDNTNKMSENSDEATRVKEIRKELVDQMQEPIQHEQQTKSDQLQKTINDELKEKKMPTTEKIKQTNKTAKETTFKIPKKIEEPSITTATDNGHSEELKKVAKDKAPINNQDLIMTKNDQIKKPNTTSDAVEKLKPNPPTKPIANMEEQRQLQQKSGTTTKTIIEIPIINKKSFKPINPMPKIGPQVQHKQSHQPQLVQQSSQQQNNIISRATIENQTNKSLVDKQKENEKPKEPFKSPINTTSTLQIPQQQQTQQQSKPVTSNSSIQISRINSNQQTQQIETVSNNNQHQQQEQHQSNGLKDSINKTINNENETISKKNISNSNQQEQLISVSTEPSKQSTNQKTTNSGSIYKIKELNFRNSSKENAAQLVDPRFKFYENRLKDELKEALNKLNAYNKQQIKIKGGYVDDDADSLFDVRLDLQLSNDLIEINSTNAFHYLNFHNYMTNAMQTLIELEYEAKNNLIYLIDLYDFIDEFKIHLFNNLSKFLKEQVINGEMCAVLKSIDTSAIRKTLNDLHVNNHKNNSQLSEIKHFNFNGIDPRLRKDERRMDIRKIPTIEYTKESRVIAPVKIENVAEFDKNEQIQSPPAENTNVNRLITATTNTSTAISSLTTNSNSNNETTVKVDPVQLTKMETEISRFVTELNKLEGTIAKEKLMTEMQNFMNLCNNLVKPTQITTSEKANNSSTTLLSVPESAALSNNLNESANSSTNVSIITLDGTGDDDCIIVDEIPAIPMENQLSSIVKREEQQPKENSFETTSKSLSGSNETKQNDTRDKTQSNTTIEQQSKPKQFLSTNLIDEIKQNIENNVKNNTKKRSSSGDNSAKRKHSSPEREHRSLLTETDRSPSNYKRLYKSISPLSSPQSSSSSTTSSPNTSTSSSSSSSSSNSSSSSSSDSSRYRDYRHHYRHDHHQRHKSPPPRSRSKHTYIERSGSSSSSSYSSSSRHQLSKSRYRSRSRSNSRERRVPERHSKPYYLSNKKETIINRRITSAPVTAPIKKNNLN